MQRRRALHRFTAGDDRGSVLVVVALGLLPLMSAMALAIDIGMLFTARAEAQRAAESAALAGASAFMEGGPHNQVAMAKQRAREFAATNDIRGISLDTTVILTSLNADSSVEMVVQVIPSEFKVRVWTFRESVPLWFARVFGADQWTVKAMAAAEAVASGTARCVKPFAVPDAWYDHDDDTNRNHVWDGNEDWELGSSPMDRYEVLAPNHGNATTATGYGSWFRNDYPRDYGRRIQLKVADPNDVHMMAPSIFLPWQIDPWPGQEQCASQGGGQNQPGAATFRTNICTCNPRRIELGVEYPVLTGNMTGPTFQGVQQLISDDPNAWWNPLTNRVEDSVFGEGWIHSPRIITVPLFDPRQVTGSGMQNITFNNFGLFFIEEQSNPSDSVTGRFLYYAKGDSPGAPGSGTVGSLVRSLRLTE